MKLFGSAKTLRNISGKIKSGKNVQSLQVVQVVLVHYNLVDNQYQQKPEYYIILLLINLMLIC